MAERRLFKIDIEYFKASGKLGYTGEAEIEADCVGPGEIAICYMQDIVDTVRKMRDEKQLPGLSGRWYGPIRVTCEEHGFPVLILD